MNKDSTKVIAKNSALNLTYTILNIIFPLIMMTYASRVLGPEGIGYADYSKNIVSYFILLATLGLPIYGIREIAKAHVKRKKLNKVFTELFLINIGTTAISCGLFTAFVFSPIMNADRTVLLCSSVQLLLNFANIDWLYQGLEQYTYIVFRSIFVKIISVFMIFFCVKDRNDYIIYALITSVALAGNYIFNLIYARKYVHFDFNNLNLKKHFKPLFYFGAALLFSSIYSKVDITMLGTMCSKDDVGIYSNAFQIVSVAACVSTSISTVFLPRLSLYYNTDYASFNELLQFGIRVTSFLAFPIMAMMYIVAPLVVEILFGSAFSASADVIRILSILVLIKSFGDLLCYRLCIATEHEKDRLPVYAVAAGINICMNSLLIPFAGCNGAAISSVVSELYLNISLFIKMKRVVGYSIQVKPIVQNLFSSILMSFVAVGLMQLNINVLLKLSVIIFVSILIYFVSSYLMSLRWPLNNAS